MKSRRASLALALVVLASCRDRPADPQAATLRRGRFAPRILLTGEMEAARAHEIRVPLLPERRVTVKRLLENGQEVKAGEVVAELDPTPFAQPLLQSELAVLAAEHELERLAATGRAERIRRWLELEERGVGLEKATIQADVPPELEAEMIRRRKQLEVFRAELARARSGDDLDAWQVGERADRRVQELSRGQSARDAREARQAIDSLELKAPVAGLLVLADNPWEGRPIVPGDPVFVGWKVASIPDLASLRVLAWLSDVDDGAIAVGGEVDIQLDAFPEDMRRGKIVEVGRAAQESVRDSRRRFFRVTIELAEPPSPRMLPGHSVKVMAYGRAVDDAWLAPRAALEVEPGGTRLVLADGRRVAVELGACNPQECVLVRQPDGLDEGAPLGRAGTKAS